MTLFSVVCCSAAKGHPHCRKGFTKVRNVTQKSQKQWVKVKLALNVFNFFFSIKRVLAFINSDTVDNFVQNFDNFESIHIQVYESFR